MKRTLLILLIISLLSMAGCGTMKGLGQDISTAGDWIEKTAEKTKP